MNRHLFFAGWSILVLVALNGMIVQKEHVLNNGRVLLLPLAPRDPRSLMQGDYMAIRYAQPPDFDTLRNSLPFRGSVAFRLDARGVGVFSRVLPPGSKPASDEIRVNYRKSRRGTWNGGDLLFAASSYLFQEGRAQDFDRARFGELRVAPSGECLLVNLRDEALKPIGKPVH